MKKNFILILSFVLLAFTACNNDENEPEVVNAVAFAATSVNLSAAATPIEIKFATPTVAAGSVTVSFVETAVVSGTDFTTLPAASAKTVVVPFEKGVSSVTFTFNKLIEAIEGQVKNVVFTIQSATINATISENKSIQVNFNETASLGNALAPEVGGPTEPNQVFVDLSSGKMTAVPRVSWDLGFYSGTDFRVIINHTVKMSAKQTTSTNIDEVQTEDATMIFNQGSGSTTQVDDPAGDITKTTIAAISATDSENKVYVINMGSNPATTKPDTGNEGTANGPSRGWKKVRILRSGSDYKVQYADIAATTHEEITITKNAAYNFTFLSLLDKKTVSVEPQKAQWDISFTSFTNTTNFGTGLVPYNFADFVLNNVKGGAKTYQVLTTAFTYDAFALANVESAKFTDDQRNIGSNWRGTVSGTDANGNPTSGFAAKSDRFYVVKDPAGNVYKVRFTAGLNAAGERGNPTFQYAILK